MMKNHDEFGLFWTLIFGLSLIVWDFWFYPFDSSVPILFTTIRIGFENFFIRTHKQKVYVNGWLQTDLQLMPKKPNTWFFTEEGTLNFLKRSRNLDLMLIIIASNRWVNSNNLGSFLTINWTGTNILKLYARRSPRHLEFCID